ncbi:hypothetical protein [Streptomyces sp. BE303]|uniref:hypothetical protein n=1 Tax=Streptomyces sp. BE303 TaxID=3002528 RepID=UPI002E78F319|nr:hypothetical protein [Streptomyces sp. BE303]MED7947712.1 hypothetical protein [Streptomyces sp. BE303]
MRLAPRLTVATLTAALTLTAAAVAAPAAPAVRRPLPVPDTRYCAAVVGHATAEDDLGRAYADAVCDLRFFRS